jgi:hypothetical protein
MSHAAVTNERVAVKHCDILIAREDGRTCRLVCCLYIFFVSSIRYMTLLLTFGADVRQDGAE